MSDWSFHTEKCRSDDFITVALLVLGPVLSSSCWIRFSLSDRSVPINKHAGCTFRWCLRLEVIFFLWGSETTSSSESFNKVWFVNSWRPTENGRQIEMEVNLYYISSFQHFLYSFIISFSPCLYSLPFPFLLWHFIHLFLLASVPSLLPVLPGRFWGGGPNTQSKLLKL